MKLRLKLSVTLVLLLSFFIFSCDFFQSEREYSVSFNAVWNEDYTKTLIFETQWKSRSPNPIFHADYKGREWVNKAYIANENLKNPVLFAEWADEEEDSAMGWFQSTLVFWNEAKKSIFYSYQDYGIVRNLETGKVHTLSIPTELIKKIFKDGNNSFHENGRVPVMETLPSPNGEFVSVFHQATVQKSAFVLVDFSAIGVFTVEGKCLGYIVLDEWNLKENIYLKNDPFGNIDVSRPWSTMPTSREYYVFWEDDSSGFFVRQKYPWDPQDPENTNQLAQAIKVEITGTPNAYTLSSEYLDVFPPLKKPTSGGSIQTNTLLAYKEKGGNNYEIAVKNY